MSGGAGRLGELGGGEESSPRLAFIGAGGWLDGKHSSSPSMVALWRGRRVRQHGDVLTCSYGVVKGMACRDGRWRLAGKATARRGRRPQRGAAWRAS